MRRLAVAAALVVVVAACATPKPTGPLLLHPVPPTGEPYSLVQGALVFSGPDFSVSARPWDYRLVAEEFRRAGVLRELGGEKNRVFLERHIGRTVRALVQGQPGRRRGATHGLTGNYLTVFVRATKEEVGHFRNVRVTRHEGGKLHGEFCD